MGISHRAVFAICVIGRAGIARLKMRLVKASDRWHFCLMGARTTDKELDCILPKDSEEDICYKTATGA